MESVFCYSSECAKYACKNSMIHRRKIAKPNECEGTQCTSLTKALKDHNYPLICGQLPP